jgi:hypothetical protein
VNPFACLPNPFAATVVSDAWSPPEVDVASIHRAPFDECLRALDSVSRGSSDSILIYGPAGSGKTHLLARLQRHLVATAASAPDGTLRCVFVSLKLQTNAHVIWQFVRRRLASDLLRKHKGITQLQRLVAHQLAAARGHTPAYWVRAMRVLPASDDGTVSEYLAEVADRLDLGRDLCVVLDHLANNRFILDAKAWLSGDSLPEAALGRLSLGGDEQEDREDAARQVVTALCRLAGETLPIVFCFDQIEALQSAPDDRESLFRFGRMAADLADADTNVLLISCIQSAFLDLLSSGVRQADRDRVFKRRAVLDPLSRQQVEALVLSRLDGEEALAALRRDRAADRLFPFRQAFVDELAAISPCVPRQVIAAASAGFERLQRGAGPEAPPLPPDDFIAGAFAARRAAALASSRPTESQGTLLHGLPLLWAVRGDKPSSQQIPGVDLVLPSGSDLLGVAVCNETNMTSLARRLRQLVQGSEVPGAPRLAVFRDPRLPITRTAKRTQEYLGALEKRGARVVEPTAEALAALEALRSLLSDARAGDLAAQGAAVAEGTVKAWLARNLDEALLDLVDVLGPAKAGAAPDDTQLGRDLGDLLGRRFVVKLSAAAAELGCADDRALAVARRHPERIGVLEGPPVVLFVHVSAESLAQATE